MISFPVLGNPDSLRSLLPKASGRQRVLLYSKLGYEWLSIDRDSALLYANKGLELAKKGNYDSLAADGYNNIGSIYLENGEFSESLNNFIQAEKTYESAKDPEGRIKATMNIGIVYEYQALYEKSERQYESALAIAKELGNDELRAQTLGHLGSLMYTLKKKEASLAYFSDALQLYTKLSNATGVMESLNNVAVIYQEFGKYTEALQYLFRALHYARKMGSKSDVVINLHNIGLVFKDKKDFPTAIRYIDSCVVLARVEKDFANLQEANSTLYEIYLDQKDPAKALVCFRESSIARDSLLARDKQKQFAEMSTKYETEKKESENKMLKSKHEADLAIAAEKEKKLNVITYSIAVGLIIVILFSFVLSNRLKITRQQKRIIEAQKQVVDEKQKEILDSIHYAQRIQNAILAKEEDIKKQLPVSFLFYQPKDIVAGDFYFFDSTDKHVFYAAADCTGHGVPGALVSVVCSNALSRCVKEFDLHDPGKILDKARELVLETFKKSGQDVKDGMDISFLVKDSETNKFHWAGANNPLWIIRNNNGAPALEEVTANKQPIGLHENPTPFTTHNFELGKGDSVYLFTDGMPDQFGGPKGKKYKYKRLQEKLLGSALLSVDEQKKLIQQDLNEWMGTNEQVDDILLIGFRG